jgi:hypothetical protein
MGVVDDEPIGQNLAIKNQPTNQPTKSCTDLQPYQSLSTSTFSSSNTIHTQDSFRSPQCKSQHICSSPHFTTLISSPKPELGLVGIVVSVLHVFDAISGCWLLPELRFAF